MDEEDFLAAVEADNANLPVEEPKEPEAPEPEAAEPIAEPAPAEPAPEPANPLAPPAVEAKPDPGFVPITALLDVRDRAQKAEAELAQFRAQQKQPEPAPIPDMFEDPEGYTSALAEKFQAQLYQQSLQMSERFARNQYGSETTDAALQWAHQKCETDPYFNAQVRGSGDPVGYAVQQYQRDRIVQTVTPDDLAEFQAWKAAQAAIRAPQPVNPATPPAPPNPLPPRSLASAPSAGGVMSQVAKSDEEIFDEVIPKR